LRQYIDRGFSTQKVGVRVNGVSPSEDAQPEWRSDMIDVSEVPLSELLADSAADTVLAQSLRRLADDLAHPGEPVAGFNSAL
jgi:FXSXX-COOH protein